MRKIRCITVSVLAAVVLLSLPGCFSASDGGNHNEDEGYAYEDDTDYGDYAYDNNEGSDDNFYADSKDAYIQAVKKCNLYSDFPGVAISSVIDAYVQAPEWTCLEPVSGSSEWFVTVKGNFKEDACPLVASFAVTDIPDQPGMVNVRVFSAKYDNVILTGDQNISLIYNMFNSYYNGYAKLSDWINDNAKANNTEANNPAGNNSGLPKGFYWVEEPRFVKGEDYFSSPGIIGVIRNESGISKNVSVTFNLYDSSGYLVDTQSRLSKVDNGTSWKFDIGSFEEFSRYELVEVKVY